MRSSDQLSRLLDVLQSSLAMYLADSGLWTYPGGESLKLAVADLVSDHRSLAERVGVALDRRGVVAPAPAYPIHFTGCHDVDMQSLAPRVIQGLRHQAGQCDAIIAATGPDGAAADPETREFAREARESSLAHLAALEQALAAARGGDGRQASAGPASTAP